MDCALDELARAVRAGDGDAGLAARPQKGWRCRALRRDPAPWRTTCSACGRPAARARPRAGDVFLPSGRPEGLPRRVRRRARGIVGPEVRSSPRSPGSFRCGRCFTTGASAELQTAVYEALGAVASGVPPREVAIVLRSFAPYTAALDALFDSGEPLWHTSYTRPLRRDPKATAALRAIADAADRGARGFRDHADELAALARRASADERLTSLLEHARRRDGSRRRSQGLAGRREGVARRARRRGDRSARRGRRRRHPYSRCDAVPRVDLHAHRPRRYERRRLSAHRARRPVPLRRVPAAAPRIHRSTPSHRGGERRRRAASSRDALAAVARVDPGVLAAGDDRHGRSSGRWRCAKFHRRLWTRHVRCRPIRAPAMQRGRTRPGS
jgi:hypothetical protein